MTWSSLIWSYSSCYWWTLRCWLYIFWNINASNKILWFWSHKSIIIRLRNTTLNIFIIYIRPWTWRALNITWLTNSFIYNISNLRSTWSCSKRISIRNINIHSLIDNLSFLLLKWPVRRNISTFLPYKTLLKTI